MENWIRKAYVAGKFYPSSKLEILNMIEGFRVKASNFIPFNPSEISIIGGILPHAGHIYSGLHLVRFFEILRKSQFSTDSFIILHPIHRGGALAFAGDESEYWSTPLGKMQLDQEFMEEMKLPRQHEMHKWEHSAEVILPFLQYYRFNEAKILPIGICWQHPDSSQELARVIRKTSERLQRRICLLASSDFSHYVGPEEGKLKDQVAVEKILKLDSLDLHREIMKNHISICGYGPIMSLLDYSRLAYPNAQLRLISEGHSGEVRPDETVVHYKSFICYSLKNE